MAKKVVLRFCLFICFLLEKRKLCWAWTNYSNSVQRSYIFSGISCLKRLIFVSVIYLKTLSYFKKVLRCIFTALANYRWLYSKKIDFTVTVRRTLINLFWITYVSSSGAKKISRDSNAIPKAYKTHCNRGFILMNFATYNLYIFILTFVFFSTFCLSNRIPQLIFIPSCKLAWSNFHVQIFNYRHFISIICNDF